MGTRLEVLRCVLATCPDKVSSEQRTGVTEVCSELLSMSRSEGSSLLLTAWVPQEPDISACVLSLLARLLSSAARPGGGLRDGGVQAAGVAAWQSGGQGHSVRN